MKTNIGNLIGIKQIKIGKIAFLLLLASPFFSLALEFKSFVDKTEIGLNEPFYLNLEFSSDKDLPKDVSVPALFNLKGFHFLDESSSSQSSITIVNGKIEKTKAFLKRYRLQAKALGSFEIPALQVKTNIKNFQTQPFKIKVVSGRTSNPSSSKSRSFMNPSLFFNSPADLFSFPNPFENVKRGDFKLKAEIGDQTIYKFQSVFASWFLLYPSRAPAREVLSIPSLKGFWKEEIFHDPPYRSSEAIGDTLYIKESLQSFWLFPLKSGTFKIEPYSARVVSGFNSQVVSSKEMSVQVRELPTRGLNSSFTGAVGDFKVEFKLSPQKEVVLNQPISFKIIFEGLGHPRFIRLPEFSFPPEVEMYEPVQKSSFTKEGRGFKEFEILLIPKKLGELTIPAIKLSTFDPKSVQYVVHESPVFNLFVKKGNIQNNSSQTFFKAEGEEGLKPDLLKSNLYWSSFISYKNLIHFFLVFFILGFCILAFFWMSGVFNKKQSMKKQVKNKIRKIEKLLKKGDYKSACVDMISLGHYVLSFSQIDEVPPHWREALKALPPSLSDRYTKEFESLFTNLESLSFSSSSLSSDIMLRKAENNFKKLETLISSFIK